MPTRQSPAVAALFVVLAAGLLVGCAGGTAHPGGQVSATPSESNGATPSSAVPSAVPSSGKVYPSPSRSSKQAPAELTLTGQVEEGVEADCLVMTSGTQMYQLIGGDRHVVRPGNRVIVRGRPVPGLMTTCQQGIPFQVTEARLA
jgi:hypothetical protein